MSDQPTAAPVPQIYTYAADNPETPARIRYAAGMDQSAPGLHWIAFGATREEARDKLARLWTEHEARKPKPGPKRKAAEGETPADDEPEEIGDVL